MAWGDPPPPFNGSISYTIGPVLGEHCTIIGGMNTHLDGKYSTAVNCVNCTAKGDRIVLISCFDLTVDENDVIYINNRKVETKTVSGDDLYRAITNIFEALASLEP